LYLSAQTRRTESVESAGAIVALDASGHIPVARLPVGTEEGDVPVLGAGGKIAAAQLPAQGGYTTIINKSLSIQSHSQRVWVHLSTTSSTGVGVPSIGGKVRWAPTATTKGWLISLYDDNSGEWEVSRMSKAVYDLIGAATPGGARERGKKFIVGDGGNWWVGRDSADNIMIWVNNQSQDPAPLIIERED